MADREAQQKLYAYGEMSNKVQQASHTHCRHPNDATGEVESLRDCMGDAVKPVTVVGNSKRPVEVEEEMVRARRKSFLYQLVD